MGEASAGTAMITSSPAVEAGLCGASHAYVLATTSWSVYDWRSRIQVSPVMD
ncbi:uncharacterized protein RAG0_15735 [Rhynchosporium agropyri]|uniref:Uncharacterized protein n=1 Tax=Rhynchosporium agropyri TaxID=914238 RepID=A0A1E1LME5_9HELO|nr:uncharacterized protein RAG0_15735 [Rhynchosporium agropyri]